jgi:outer membrane protein OmpA-like peptidoglycan-associated protein
MVLDATLPTEFGAVMNKLFTLCISSIALAGFAACTSTPPRIASLEEARQRVQQVEAMPHAGEVAAAEIDGAHQALREADTLVKEHGKLQEINNAAYLANRHAQVAEQLINEANAKQATTDSATERDRIVLQARNAEVVKQREQLKDQKAELQGEVDAAKQRADQLQQELADMNAKKTDRGMVLTLGDVLFDTGKATLKPGANSTLARLSTYLKQSTESSVLIEGHTDNVGSSDYNAQLSQRRAQAVQNELLSQGVNAQQITAVGKGEDYPVAGNDTAAGRQQNRRVEVIIQNSAMSSNTGPTPSVAHQ